MITSGEQAIQFHSPPAGHAPAAAFTLMSAEETLTARGVVSILRGPVSELGPALAAFLAARRDYGEAPVLVGAMPFDPAEPAYFVEPRSVVLSRGAVFGPRPASDRDGERSVYRVEARPTRQAYEQAVATALARLTGEGPLRKVVLARRLVVEAPDPIDPRAILDRLQTDRSVTSFCVPLPGERGPRTLVGATPELLVKREGLSVSSQPLAGSARRQADVAEDRAAAEALLRSEKDLREHETVVEWIADRLAPYCATLSVPHRPRLISTRSMWHLATPIHGELRDESATVVELAAALHPTPAVCGVPADLARATIRELEPFERGFFTGAVGWCAANGDGEWLVAIRCAEIAGRTAELFAGAGIVPGSTPSAEADETAAKFAALLRALALDAGGRMGEDAW